MAAANTVLIIDDDSEYRKLMGEILQEHGWQVLHAAAGEEGIKIAKAHRPDVVLCDLLMARGNGFQVCRALRPIEALRHTKIIVTSGRDFESDRQAALSAGAHDYLTKPINPGRLAALLTNLVGGSASGGAALPPASAAVADSKSPLTSSSATRLKFWGVRGSIPTPGPTTIEYGGNTSCVEVRADGEIIILDAGTGLRLLGRELVSEFENQPLHLSLLLTHTHWDHIQGLPFFLPVYRPQNQLRILGFEGARHGLANILTGQMESPFFPIGLREVPANVQIEELKDFNFHVGPVRVQACFANHPGICVGYRLFTSHGSIAFFPDNELHQRQRRSPRSGKTSGNTTMEFAREEDQKLIDFLIGVDVLIIDSQYDAEEYQQHVGWGHGCVDDVVALAMAARVKRLFLFHHDPNHDDAKVSQMVAHARKLVTEAGGALVVDAAREGSAVELK
jgi:phosphoribosyl 1,2-cyclic phosphodiesterase/DNA-binding NarL/FixJ family response regulator